MKHMKENKLFTVVMIALAVGLILSFSSKNLDIYDKIVIKDSPLYHAALMKSIEKMENGDKAIVNKGTIVKGKFASTYPVTNCNPSCGEYSSCLPQCQPTMGYDVTCLLHNTCEGYGTSCDATSCGTTCDATSCPQQYTCDGYGATCDATSCPQEYTCEGYGTSCDATSCIWMNTCDGKRPTCDDCSPK